jgi:nucleotide-binding universal stress UspA family protein
MKLLIGYDGSECSAAAIDDLKRAGLPDEVDAIVISVAEVWLPPTLDVESSKDVHLVSELHKRYMKNSKVIAETEAMAHRAQLRLQHNFPKWYVTIETTYGSPAWEIITRADEWKPDLIALGSHGRTAVGRFVLGSVSQKVLTESKCSVRIARGHGEMERTPERIVVAIDGSDAAEEAVKEVCSRKWTDGSSARVVIVDEPMEMNLVGQVIPPIAHFVEEVNRNQREKFKQIANDAAVKLNDAGLQTSALICNGNPKREIVNQAEEWEADNIFVGSVGFNSSLERILLGSVSAAVAARAHCSVEVVRPKKNAEART